MSVFEFFNAGLRKGISHERSNFQLEPKTSTESVGSAERSGPWMLSPYVRAGLDGGILYLGFGSLQKQITDRRRQELLLSTSHFWMTPSTFIEALDYLVKRAGATSDEAEAAVSFLAENRYLIRPTSYKPGDRFGRNALFYALAGANPEVVQRRLAQSHVVVLGCGGVGNQISCTLASAGVGRLTLIDEDAIEITHLTRQFLFAEADVGQSKAAVLCRELQRRESRLDVSVIASGVKTDGDFARIPDCDLIVVSADSGGLVPKLNAHAVSRGIPFLDVGHVQDVAVWGPFVIPGKSGCLACRQLTATEPKPGDLAWSLIREINSRYQAPSFGAVNMAAASHASLDILRYLGNFGTVQSLNQRVGIWTHDLHIEMQPCPRNPDCSVCAAV